MEYDPLLFAAKRKILKLTRKQLAERCKLTQTTIYNIETGKTNVPSTILLIGLVLDWFADEQGKLNEFYILESKQL